MSKGTRKISVAVGTVSLAATTAFGVIKATNIYDDSTIGLSSALDRYVESVQLETASAGDGSTPTDASSETVKTETAKTETKKTSKKSTKKEEKTTEAATEETETGAAEKTCKYPQFEGKCLTTVTDEVNIRATASAETVEYTSSRVDGFMGNVTLKKVDTKGTTLNGAEFQLLKVTPAEKEGAEATKTPISVVKVTNDEYKVALDEEQKATTTLVATNGTLKVTGLDEGSYEFKETKAPTGYKVNSENKAFTITADETDEVTVDAGNFVNTKLSSLPSTGGMGTYLFTIIGVVVMAGAAGAFFISRRKGSEE